MFETTLVGSLPKPAWLAEPETLWAPWRVEGASLREAQLDAVVLAIKLQEDAGLDTVSDGEQARHHFVHGFVERLAGIDYRRRVRIPIRNGRYEADCPVVTGPVGRTAPVHLEEVRHARRHTRRRLKFTLPGPLTIVDTLADEHYRDRQTLAFAFADALNAEARDLAAAGVDLIQFDEPAFNVYPELVPVWALAALERAAAGLTCETAVHICYGYGIPANVAWKSTLGDQWRQYESIFPLLAESTIGEVSVECVNSRVPLELLRLLGNKRVQLGCIDVARHAIESPELVAQVIDRVTRYVDPHRIVPSTNCGMVPLPRAVAEAKLQALTAGAELARRALAGL